MASLYVKDNIYYLQWSEIQPSGKRKRFQVSTGLKDNALNKRKAEILRREKEIELLQPKKVLSFHYPLSSAGKDFVATKKDWTDGTRQRFEASLEKFIEVNGELFCTEVTAEHVEAYKESMGNNAANTIAAHFSLMHSFFNWLKLKRYVRENHFYSIQKTARKVTPIPDDLFEQILEHCTNDTQRTILKFYLLSGFRRREAIRLRWRDIDFTNKVIYVWNGKGKRQDTFPLYNELETLLRDFRRKTKGKDADKVFGYSENNALEFWFKIRKKLNHTFIVHDLRVTFICNLVDAGKSIFDIKELARHKSVATTEKYYARANRKRLGDVAEDTFGKKKTQVLNIASQ